MDFAEFLEISPRYGRWQKWDTFAFPVAIFSLHQMVEEAGGDGNQSENCYWVHFEKKNKINYWFQC